MRHSQTFSSCLSSWNNSRYLYLENSKLPLITSTGFVHPFLRIDARRRLVKSIIYRAEVVLGAMNNSGLSLFPTRSSVYTPNHVCLILLDTIQCNMISIFFPFLYRHCKSCLIFSLINKEI